MVLRPCLYTTNIVIFTNSQSAIQAIALMQHHKQPIVTDILTTANNLTISDLTMCVRVIDVPDDSPAALLQKCV